LLGLDRWIGEHTDVRLVIIDVLARFRNSKGSRDVYQRDYETISKIKTVADKHSIAVIVVHHTNKLQDSLDVFDRVSGSTGLTAASDTVMVLERYNRVDREGKLQIAGREVLPQEMALEYDLDFGTWKYVGDASLFSMSEKRMEIFNYLENEENWKRPEEVANALGKNPNTVRVTLRKMLKDGQIYQPRYGLYTTINKLDKQT
jgi:RecA-family ATPase